MQILTLRFEIFQMSLEKHGEKKFPQKKKTVV